MRCENQHLQWRQRRRGQRQQHHWRQHLQMHAADTATVHICTQKTTIPHLSHKRTATDLEEAQSHNSSTIQMYMMVAFHIRLHFSRCQLEREFFVVSHLKGAPVAQLQHDPGL